MSDTHPCRGWRRARWRRDYFEARYTRKDDGSLRATYSYSKRRSHRINVSFMRSIGRVLKRAVREIRGTPDGA